MKYVIESETIEFALAFDFGRLDIGRIKNFCINDL
jgi:hypothetical protein